MENVVAVLQIEVQRKLGRCMLRLQQYERLLKAMVASMAVAGPLEQLEALREQHVVGVRNRTLGTLVGTFTGQHLTAAPAGAEVGAGDDTSVGHAAWASMRFSISMPPEVHAQTKADLAELVDLRNELVHHLIENFDISDENSCRAASGHLDNCYERIDGHFWTLRNWAINVSECQAQMSTFLQTNAFENAFVHGVNSHSSVCCSRSSIVECLRVAETVCQVDGWTSLDLAIAFISKENRDEIPSRYGCQTWRQVLKQSGQFELRSDAGSDGVKGHAWYRSCSKAVAPEAAPVGCVNEF